jgi:uncharacterized membrane protein YhiD involved in acid resistance
MSKRLPSSKRFTVGAAVVAAVLGFLVVAAVFRGFSGPSTGPQNAQNVNAAEPQPSPASTQNTRVNQTTDANAARTPPREQEEGSESSLSKILGDGTTPAQPTSGERGDWLTVFASVIVRLTLATLLSAMLAFRPRRFSLFFKRNPFVAQTQILLAVVASALMMIVGDSTARAFGIFAAVSLVRFRTNIKDPKEITVLLLSLAIGLATGVGRWELGLILAFFVLLLLWALEYREPELVTRAMELTVKTRNIGTTQDSLLNIFRKYKFDAEMRTIDRPDDTDAMGVIIYHVRVSPLVSTDRLSEEILSADPQNVDSVEWDQQKNTSYFYQ